MGNGKQKKLQTKKKFVGTEFTHLLKMNNITTALLTIEKNLETELWELCENFARTL